MPRLLEGVVRLGASMAFEQAADTLEFFTLTRVSEAAARRWTERAGATMVAWQDEEVERLEREVPEAPEGGETMLMSVDGAMVGLKGGEWTEVKTLAIGEVVLETDSTGREQARTRQLTYFSRRAEASEFTRAALVETHARGIERAGRVAATTDGAVWIQGFSDYHRPDAVRILDFPHGAEALTRAAGAAFGEGSAPAAQWAEAERRALRAGPPEATIAAVRALEASALARGEAAGSVVREAADYLGNRVEMLRYAAFEAAGLPIGSGAVESANKVVVEARMKGAGMRWAPRNVTPMATVRTMLRNGRWDSEWQHVTTRFRGERQQQRDARTRLEARGLAPVAPESPPPPPIASLVDAPPPTAAPKSRGPSPNHPWKRFPAVRSAKRLAAYAPVPGK
jgi:hypothetical protein